MPVADRGKILRQALQVIQCLASSRWTVDDLAAHLECSSRTVYRVLKDLETVDLGLERYQPEPAGVVYYLLDWRKIREWLRESRSPHVRDGYVTDAEIQQAVDDGLNLTESEHRLGITREGVRQRILKLGREPRKGPSCKLSQQQAKEIDARLRAGELIENIARAFDVTTRTVCVTLARHGLRPMPSRTARRCSICGEIGHRRKKCLTPLVP